MHGLFLRDSLRIAPPAVGRRYFSLPGRRESRFAIAVAITHAHVEKNKEHEVANSFFFSIAFLSLWHLTIAGCATCKPNDVNGERAKVSRITHSYVDAQAYRHNSAESMMILASRVQQSFNSRTHSNAQRERVHSTGTPSGRFGARDKRLCARLATRSTLNLALTAAEKSRFAMTTIGRRVRASSLRRMLRIRRCD